MSSVAGLVRSLQDLLQNSHIDIYAYVMYVLVFTAFMHMYFLCMLEQLLQT